MASSTRSRRTSRSISSICSPSMQSSAAIHSDRRLELLTKREMKTAGRHSVSVAGVITDGDGRVLLIRRRDTRRWEPPGGVLELDESIEAGLRREVREEIGLTIEPVALTGVYKNMARGILALVFRCNALSGHLTVNEEVSGFRWATPEE